MKRSKNIILALMVVALIVVGSIAGTMAYLTRVQNLTNTLSFGEVKLTVVDAKLAARPPNEAFSPGDLQLTEPIITNVGDVPCYVRLQLNFTNVGSPNTLIAGIQDYIYITRDRSKWDWTDYDPEHPETSYVYLKDVLQPNESAKAPYRNFIFLEETLEEEIPFLEGNTTEFDFLLSVSAVQTVEGNEYASTKEAFADLMP